MKRVISISLGSSNRDHVVETEILGEKFLIERRGTDGDIQKAIALIKELDGKVDAFGMGGIDLHIRSGNRVYTLRDAKPIARAAQKTPMVDGSGLKDTLEREVIRFLDRGPLPLAGKKVLMVSAMDRFGMAQALIEAKARVTYGDMMFSLGIPIPIHSFAVLNALAFVVAPIAVQLPFSVLYPTGKEQEEVKPKFVRYYLENDIIAGDFLYIHRHMPDKLPGKVIITNTTTAADVADMRARGVRMLVTTTPNLNGRSFGTNVMEGVLVALSGRRPEELTAADYLDLLHKINFQPQVVDLQAT